MSLLSEGMRKGTLLILVHLQHESTCYLLPPQGTVNTSRCELSKMMYAPAERKFNDCECNWYLFYLNKSTEGNMRFCLIL